MLILHASAREACGIRRPAHRQDSLSPIIGTSPRKRQRYPGLAVGVLPERRSVLRRQPNAFPSRQGCVADDQPGVFSADPPVGRGAHGLLKRHGVPNAAGDEMMELVVAGAAPGVSISSSSQSMTVRSAIAAFSIEQSVSSLPWMMTKPSTCCERWRGKPLILPISHMASTTRRSWGERQTPIVSPERLQT